ncbi:hypothetical protein Tco_0627426 [Tanacetum coccineum]|uniref:Uncharacterized protein n=1 Tax=Tanacetum coccineum TaxID=301880 RepID=A0ABQ4WME9_9ASTR
MRSCSRMHRVAITSLRNTGLDNLLERSPERTSVSDRRYCWKDRSKAAAYGYIQHLNLRNILVACRRTTGAAFVSRKELSCLKRTLLSNMSHLNPWDSRVLLLPSSFEVTEQRSGEFLVLILLFSFKFHFLNIQ